MTDPEANSETPDARGNFRELATDALRYWEWRRIIYNIILAAIVIWHFVVGWPHSKTVVTVNGVLFLFLLSVLANACYCAAYLGDVFVQFSGFREEWQRWRWIAFGVGTLFAAIITRFFALNFFASPGT